MKSRTGRRGRTIDRSVAKTIGKEIETIIGKYNAIIANNKDHALKKTNRLVTKGRMNDNDSFKITILGLKNKSSKSSPIKS